jgi:hypothetical protein
MRKGAETPTRIGFDEARPKRIGFDEANRKLLAAKPKKYQTKKTIQLKTKLKKKIK